MLQKYRVFCPHCAASLLVTEDLLGTTGNCPGCQHDFLLPDQASFDSEPAPAESAPAAATLKTPPPVTAGLALSEQLLAPPSDSKDRRKAKPVRIEPRPELKLFIGLMKIVALIQCLAAFVWLAGTLITALRSHPGPEAVLMSIGGALLLGISAIPTYAFAELIRVFISQDEMLRHILNELRSREETPDSQ
jgi:hypothetical protein